MAVFRRNENEYIYLYHWLTPKRPLKISTGLKIDIDKWDNVTRKAKSSRTKYAGKYINRELSKHSEAFQQAIDYFNHNSGFTAKKLKEKYKAILSGDNNLFGNNNEINFLDYFSKKVKEYKLKNKSNWKIYNTIFNHLRTFFGREKPDFMDIDTHFFLKYQDYLIGLDLSTNSISNHWKYIKVVMRCAEFEQLHMNVNYKLFKAKRERADTIFLNESELQGIFELDLNGYLEKARDYFLIGCYTGLRYEDWDKVTWSKVNEDWIMTIVSSKTGEKSMIPVANNLIRILNKYPNCLLPVKPSNQKMNKYIKEVAKKAGLNEVTYKRITKGGKRTHDIKPKYARCCTHTARRSFATINILNNVPYHLVMKMTGHKSISDFEKYVRLDELQAAISLKSSATFNKSFGKPLTWSEKLDYNISAED